MLPQLHQVVGDTPPPSEAGLARRKHFLGFTEVLQSALDHPLVHFPQVQREGDGPVAGDLLVVGMATLAASRSEETIRLLTFSRSGWSTSMSTDLSSARKPVPVSRFVPEPGYWRGTPYVSRMGHADGDGKVIGGEGIRPNLPPHSTSQVR